MTEAELLALHDRHEAAILRAMRSMPPMPFFDHEGSFQGGTRNYMFTLLGSLLANGVPVADAKPLAVDIAMMVSNRQRENLGHEAGHG